MVRVAIRVSQLWIRFGKPSALAALGVAPLVAASLPTAYQLPPLTGDGQDKPFRTQSEVAATARRVLADYADQELAARGFLDVTKAPYLARGDGVADDTSALQRALKDARDARLVVWLPPGTYLVRDTLQCVQGDIDRRRRPGDGGGELLRNLDFPCVIQGARADRRALIKLADNATGFDDPMRPKPVLYIWARSWDPPYDVQANVSFNQVLLGVDFDIRGHAGAIAVDMQGAQGTAVQDIRIEAAGAFAGMRGLTGSGGSTHGLTVHGGRYGVFAAAIGQMRLTGSQPAPLLAQALLHGQTDAAIYFSGRGPLTLVGVGIRGKGIVCKAPGQPYNGALNVIDSSLDIEGGAAVVSDRPVYLNETYIRGAEEIVRISARTRLTPATAGWTRVREFAGAPDGPFPIWVDGRKQSSPLAVVEAASPPEDLLSRHALPRLPAWNGTGVINAQREPYRAAGDSRTDDSAAIQRALEENDTVFLPKGTYRLGRPLVLPPGKTLFGAGRTLTVLAPLPGAEAFSDKTAPRPLVDTVDAPRANTMIARLQIKPAAAGAYGLRWRAGGPDAALLDVEFRISATAGHVEGASVRIEDGGGGRWFNFGNHSTVSGSGPGYRHLRVERTHRPLTFYMLNVEHARSEMNAEFVDTRDVTIYALKGETFQIGNPATGTRPLVWVRDAAGFRVFGGGGICGAAPGWPPFVYRFDNCRDILVANAGHQYSTSLFAEPRTWSLISDRWAGREVNTPGDEYFVLYRR